MKWGLVLLGGMIFGLLLGVLLPRGFEREVVGTNIAAEVIEEYVPVLESEVLEFTVVAVGDVMLGRSVNTRMMKYGSVDWPFAKTGEFLRGADLTLGNLENPLIKDCLSKDDGMIFCGRLEAVEGLERAGFDGMSLANNHSYNYGEEGVIETVNILEENGIQAVGNGLVGEYEINGVKVGVMAYDDVSQRLVNEDIIKDIEEGSIKFDMVLVMIHWGTEYVSEPTERQVGIGKEMIDAGARIILGSHPHWTQRVEEYGEGIIFYSLGNFVFDQMWSEETRLGDIVSLKLKTQNSKIIEVDYELIPVKINDYGQPEIVNEGVGVDISRQYNQLE